MQRSLALQVALITLVAALRVWLAGIIVAQAIAGTPGHARAIEDLKATLAQLDELIAALKAHKPRLAVAARRLRALFTRRRTIVARPTPIKPILSACVIDTIRRTTTAYGIHPPPWHASRRPM